ncbi:MAG: hypothetical protein M0C28_41055 [Candidatus Moduliflexus flocculans]|nr:hypothetical protein [Candidatus Moduliflexus flocculans]
MLPLGRAGLDLLGAGAAEAIARATSLGWILFGAAALLAGLAMLGLRRLGWSFKRLRWAACPWPSTRPGGGARGRGTAAGPWCSAPGSSSA